MILLALLLDLFGRQLNCLCLAEYGVGPFRCGGHGLLRDYTQRNSQVFAPVQLLPNSLWLEGIVEVFPIFGYLLALFVRDWLSSIEGFYEWCCNTADWVSEARYTALFELSAAREIGSLLPIPLSDDIGIVREALLLAFG